MESAYETMATQRFGFRRTRHSDAGVQNVHLLSGSILQIASRFTTSQIGKNCNRPAFLAEL